MKPWLVWDSGNGHVEEYDTEAEALAYCKTSLELYREEAAQDGEWHDEVESMAIYKLAHHTVVVESGGDEENDEADWVEYGIRPAP